MIVKTRRRLPASFWVFGILIVVALCLPARLAYVQGVERTQIGGFEDSCHELTGTILELDEESKTFVVEVLDGGMRYENGETLIVFYGKANGGIGREKEKGKIDAEATEGSLVEIGYFGLPGNEINASTVRLIGATE